MTENRQDEIKEKKMDELYRVIIKPRLEENRETLCKDLRKIDLIKNDVKIINTKRIKSGLVVEMKRKEDGDKIIDLIKTNTEDGKYIVETLTKRKPQIILYGLNNEITKEELENCLIKQNDIEKEDFVIVHNYKVKYGTNWICEVNGKSFKKLVGWRKVNIGFEKIKVREYLKPRQCFECWRYGHKGKDCKNKKICVRCGDDDHDNEICQKSMMCANCNYQNVKFNRNIDSKHSPNDLNCPCLQNEIKKVKKYIYYG